MSRDSAPKAARVTTYPGIGKGGSDKRYIVGPLQEAAALRDQTLAANPGATVTFEEINAPLDRAVYCVQLPTEAT